MLPLPQLRLYSREWMFGVTAPFAETFRWYDWKGSMTIEIDHKLEARLREKAEAEGLTVSAYVERLVSTEQAAEEELESLALEGLNSGEPIEVGPGYWAELHRELDERLKL